MLATYNIRNYRPSDFERYRQLRTEAEGFEPAGQRSPPQTLSERLRRPNYSPEQDLFIVETPGNIVGYLNITPELRLGRVILDCLIHPEHRRQGLASRLLECAMSRAGELGARIAQVNILVDNAAARSTLSRLGFRFVRRFLEMRLDITRLDEGEINRAARQCRNLRPGEEAKLAEIQNCSFAGAWGYNPNTVPDITHQLSLNRCCPEDILLAESRNRVTGYCWTSTVSEGKGKILMLGVDPDGRRQGIGKRLLLAGLSRLKSRGGSMAELTVDSRNKAAGALYQSIGFQIQDISLWYQKTVG